MQCSSPIVMTTTVMTTTRDQEDHAHRHEMILDQSCVFPSFKCELQLCVPCRWCTMRVGALAATAANVLLLTFFVLQSFQSPFGKRHLAQINRMMDMQRQALMAAEEHFKLGNPSAESYFKLWIKKDLSTWAQEGISEVSLLRFLCDSSSLLQATSLVDAAPNQTFLVQQPLRSMS